ncbi:MAG: hypothetical protein JNK81_09410 [Anaerolineales bacterium]|nr:hypothetical protein [Anaerolineales bacterium]
MLNKFWNIYNKIDYMRCIYCLSDKSDSAFTKAEHVMPQAFGRFQNNFTLNGVVCDECNQYFGDNLEIYLGRDTVEGISRYEYRIKDRKDFKSIGPKTRLQGMQIAEGVLKGAYIYLEYSQERDEIISLPLPQVGFQNKISLNYKYFLLDGIPERVELENEGFNCDSNVRAFGDSFELIEKALANKKISPEFEKELPLLDKKSEKLLIEYEASVDSVIKRSIAKISFNYLAYLQGADFVLQDIFNPIRFYIRNGELESTPFVIINNESILKDELQNGLARLMHIVTISWAQTGFSLISRVSIFNFLSYTVQLVRHYPNPNPNFVKGHFFNLGDYKIYELTRR